MCLEVSSICGKALFDGSIFERVAGFERVVDCALKQGGFDRLLLSACPSCTLSCSFLRRCTCTSVLFNTACRGRGKETVIFEEAPFHCRTVLKRVWVCLDMSGLFNCCFGSVQSCSKSRRSGVRDSGRSCLRSDHRAVNPRYRL